MKSVYTIFLSAAFIFVLCCNPALAIEASPHISDREIVEALTAIRGDIKKLEEKQNASDKRMDDLRSEMNGNFADLRSDMNGKFTDLRSEMNGKFADLRSEMNGKFADLRTEMNGRFEEVNHRFDALQWMLGLFITIALVILGFVLRMQWQMHRRQTRMETVLETQRDELSFIKGLIEKLMPPRGVL